MEYNMHGLTQLYCQPGNIIGSIRAWALLPPIRVLVVQCTDEQRWVSWESHRYRPVWCRPGFVAGNRGVLQHGTDSNTGTSDTDSSAADGNPDSDHNPDPDSIADPNSDADPDCDSYACAANPNSNPKSNPDSNPATDSG